jgi:hypothetical protein
MRSRAQLLEKIWLSCSSGSLALLEALPAKHRTSLRRLEWHGGFPLASGADGLGFHSLIVAAILRQSQCLGSFTFAVLAAFGFVLELFIVEEELFTSGENEVGAAVHTLENLVLKVHFESAPFPAFTQESGQSTQMTQ